MPNIPKHARTYPFIHDTLTRYRDHNSKIRNERNLDDHETISWFTVVMTSIFCLFRLSCWSIYLLHSINVAQSISKRLHTFVDVVPAPDLDLELDPEPDLEPDQLDPVDQSVAVPTLAQLAFHTAVVVAAAADHLREASRCSTCCSRASGPLRGATWGYTGPEAG